MQDLLEELYGNCRCFSMWWPLIALVRSRSSTGGLFAYFDCLVLFLRSICSFPDKHKLLICDTFCQMFLGKFLVFPEKEALFMEIFMRLLIQQFQTTFVFYSKVSDRSLENEASR